MITQPYGANKSTYAQYGLVCGHEGIDFKAPTGSKIHACADGLVKAVYDVGSGGNYGNNIRITHEWPDGNVYETIYAHLQQPLVTLGQRVKRGEAIGLADSTGNSTGSHLHLTLKKRGATASGEACERSDIMNPHPYLDAFGVP